MFNGRLRSTLKTILEIDNNQNVSIRKILDSIGILKGNTEGLAISVGKLTITVAELEAKVEKLERRRSYNEKIG
jgi:hypothetical protein